MIQRGDVWWADLGEPGGSEPANRRPVVVVQSDAFNRSRIATVVCVAITSNLNLTDAPGNVFIARAMSGLPKDSVANVSQVVTLDKDCLEDRRRRLPASAMQSIERGLKLVLGL